MAALILVACVASIVAYFVLRRGEALRFVTTARPAQVVMAAVATVGTGRRWATVSHSDGAVAFSYHKRPKFLLLLVGLIVGIVPGLVYWLLASKRESLNVMMDADGEAGTLVQVTSNGFRGRLAGRSVRQALEATPAPPAPPLGRAAPQVQVFRPEATPLRPGTAALPQTAPMHPAPTPCRRCKASVGLGARFCDACGEPVGATPSTSASPAPGPGPSEPPVRQHAGSTSLWTPPSPPTPKSSRCRSCAQVVRDQVTFCEHCGTRDPIGAGSG